MLDPAASSAAFFQPVATIRHASSLQFWNGRHEAQARGAGTKSRRIGTSGTSDAAVSARTESVVFLSVCTCTVGRLHHSANSAVVARSIRPAFRVTTVSRWHENEDHRTNLCLLLKIFFYVDLCWERPSLVFKFMETIWWPGLFLYILRALISIDAEKSLLLLPVSLFGICTWIIVHWWLILNVVTRFSQQLSAIAILLSDQALLLPGLCAWHSGRIPAHCQNRFLHLDWYETVSFSHKKQK